MAESQRPGAGGEYGRQPDQATSAWESWVAFAGVMMVIIGCFNAIDGLVAITDSDYYAVGSDSLLIRVNYTAWGWVILVFGVVVALAGIGVMAGRLWARVVGVLLTALNILVNFAYLAAYPVWTTIVIALNVVVLYALVVHGGEARAGR